LEILIIAGIVGAVGGVFCSFLFFPKNMIDKTVKKSENNEKKDFILNKPVRLTDRWSFRLAMLGFGIGIFAGLGRGTTDIAYMIGFGVPFALILSLIGLVIDFFKK
jgi:hypothetical protein